MAWVGQAIVAPLMAHDPRKIWLLGVGLSLAVVPAIAAPPSEAPPRTAPDSEPDEPPEEPEEPNEDDEALLEFHFNPVSNLQIAIWIEDADGNFIEDVFVTQATGKLGIANRPGLPDFLSSWRAPYGAREMVLPIWAHHRGKTYPKIIFHDANTNNHTSLGFHESSSSPETYFCRPLTPTEDAAIVDTMTCPSPATFQSDKGEFSAGTSYYPPRNDLTSFELGDDSEDIKSYADLNDLDAVTRATPQAGSTMIAHRLRRGDAPAGPLVAWIEVSLERDENPHWEFDREDDHWVDPKLPAYGREFKGQPAIVYRVEFDPAVEGYSVIGHYAGYADLDGATGDIHPPDSTISAAGGSGADRLRVHERYGEIGRFGVYSHGFGGSSPGDGDGDGGTGGGCQNRELPPVEQLRVIPTAHDGVRATFRLPQVPAGVSLANLYAHYVTPETSAFQLSAATEASGIPRLCRTVGELDCVVAGPGDEVSVTINQLFGNYTYTIGISYDDTCTNRSEVAFANATTPVQEFETIDGACFIATAAWGAGWTEELRALRWFRDAVMLDTPIAGDLVRYYYAYGPVLAGMIREVPPARAAARVLLRPVAKIAKLAVQRAG
jgi:hypothetical protein